MSKAAKQRMLLLVHYLCTVFAIQCLPLHFLSNFSSLLGGREREEGEEEAGAASERTLVYIDCGLSSILPLLLLPSTQKEATTA